jgi:hypothetical protein
VSLSKPLHAAEGDTQPGLRLFPMHLGNRLNDRWNWNAPGLSGVTGTCVAMAHRNPASSRAMATVTTWACWPRAMSWRSRCHRRTGAFQRMSWMLLGGCASRRGQCRLTWAGSRSAQAPATRALRAWAFPALGSAPCRRCSPEEDAEGIRPKHFISSRGVSKRVRSPLSAPMVTAPVNCTPRRA